MIDMSVLSLSVMFCTTWSGGDQATDGGRLRAAGKSASMTVAPTVTTGRPMPKVGEAVAMTLERFGMTKLETSSVAFAPPKDADLEAAARAFSEFLKANPPSTDYILWTDFQGVPGKGVSEVRAVIATKVGEVVWKDRQAPGDKDFDRIKPREPIQCCVLVAERLRPVLGLGRQGSADGGRIYERWRKESGLPTKEEAAAMEERGKAFRKNAANATLLVYPVRTAGAYSGEHAVEVAAAAGLQKLAKAQAAADGPKIEPAGDINEQKVLWAMARAFSEHVQKNPPDADYVLYADYLMNKDTVFAVHFAVCNREGELVAVEHHNRNTSEFKAVNPKSREDCDRLLVKRLEKLVR